MRGADAKGRVGQRLVRAVGPVWEHNNPNPTLNSKGVAKGNMLTGSPCPTRTHAWDFPGLQNPHVPSWGRWANGTVPHHMGDMGDPDKTGCCDAWEEERQHFVYRNRSAAVVDLDDMLGKIFGGLAARGVADDTFVFFSSDNGCAC